MDDSDRAAAYQERLNKAAAAARAKPMAFTGHCRNCGELIKQGLFCCPECSEDYQKIQRAKKQNIKL